MTLGSFEQSQGYWKKMFITCVWSIAFLFRYIGSSFPLFTQNLMMALQWSWWNGHFASTVLVSLRNCLISVLPICCNVGITSLILIILIVCDLGICHYLYPTSFEPNQGQGLLKKFSDWGTSIAYIILTSLPLVTHEDCTCNSILNVNRIEKDNDFLFLKIFVHARCTKPVCRNIFSIRNPRATP